LTAIKLIYSREEKIQYKYIVFDTIVKSADYVPEFSKFGAIIQGLYLEGATTNHEGLLVDSEIKIFYTTAPYIE